MSNGPSPWRTPRRTLIATCRYLRKWRPISLLRSKSVARWRSHTEGNGEPVHAVCCRTESKAGARPRGSGSAVCGGGGQPERGPFDRFGGRRHSVALAAGSGFLFLAAGHRRNRAFAALPRRRGSVSVVEEVFRRLSRIPLRLVLLDQQRVLRSDSTSLSGRDCAVRSRPERGRAGEQPAVHFFRRADRTRTRAAAEYFGARRR